MRTVCRFLEIDNNLWYTKLWNDLDNENGNKLRTYRQFKTEFELEPYIMLNTPWYVTKSVVNAYRWMSTIRNGKKARYKMPKVPLNERGLKCVKISVLL